MTSPHSARQPMALPPTQFDWTNCNFRMLSELAGSFYGMIPPSLDVVDALNNSADRIVSDASWQGDAADKFKAAWKKNATDAQAFTDTVNAIGAVIDQLAIELAWIQNWWEQQAAYAEATMSKDPQKIRTFGEKCAQQATHKVKEVQEKAAKALTGIHGDKIAATLNSYAHDPEIPAGDLKTFNHRMKANLKDFNHVHGSLFPGGGSGTDDTILDSHTFKDATGGAFIGGTLGLLGGPFEPITVPGGTATGTVIGGLWGLGEDFHLW